MTHTKFIEFNHVRDCPYWDKDDGTCKNSRGPAYCTNKPENEASGHCPLEDVEELVKSDNQITFEHTVGNSPCYIDTRWDGCCCVCANHSPVNKHCCHSPKEEGKCVCGETLDFNVCTGLHKLDGSPVNLSGNHGFCELFESNHAHKTGIAIWGKKTTSNTNRET